MTSKFMKLNQLAVTMIISVLLVSQLAGCSLFSQQEVEDASCENEAVEIQIPEADPVTDLVKHDSDIGLIEEDYTPYYKEIYEFGQSIGEGLADGACYEIEKGTAQDYVADGRIPSIDAYSAWRLAEHPLPANQTEFNRDEGVFIDPTELDPNAFQETSGQPEAQQPVENGQPSKVENSQPTGNTSSTGSSSGSGTQTPSQPVEQPSTSNNTSSAEGIENGMITAGGLNRPANPFGGPLKITQEDIDSGRAGTISDEALEEVSKGWKTN